MKTDIFAQKSREMSSNKRRRNNDENVVSDTSIADFLDLNPILYKKIQLGAYLNEITKQGVNVINVDWSSPLTVCTSIMDSIMSIINKFFIDAKPHDSNGRPDKYDFHSNSKSSSYYKNIHGDNNFFEIEFWLDNEYINEQNIFDVACPYFKTYLNTVSTELNKGLPFSLKIDIVETTEYCFNITIVGF